MKLMFAIIAPFLMMSSLLWARDACAFVGFPPDYAFGRLVIADGGQTVVLHHPTNMNSGPLHLRHGMSNYTVVDAWWERDGNTAKIMIHVVDNKTDSPERDMLLGSAHIG